MQTQHPFRTVTPTLDGEVLVVLAGADASFTPPEVHRLLGRRSEAGVRKALQRLVEQGVVTAERVGRAVTYSLNRRHIAAPNIIAMAGLYDELLDRLRRQFASWKLSPEHAALFGSAVRRDMRPDSDIDLLVVRPDNVAGDDPVWRDQIDTLAADVTAWTGNDTRVLELNTTDVRRGLDGGVQMYDDLRREGVTLHGPPDYLRRRAGSASTQ